MSYCFVCGCRQFKCPAEMYPDLIFATVYYNCVLLSPLKIVNAPCAG